jgi:hypothetical protein
MDGTGCPSERSFVNVENWLRLMQFSMFRISSQVNCDGITRTDIYTSCTRGSLAIWHSNLSHNHNGGVLHTGRKLTYLTVYFCKDQKVERYK